MKRLLIVAYVAILPMCTQQQKVQEEVEITLEEVPDEWETLTKALIIVESEGNPLAIGKTNDVGVLQIKPIYVREVNRILRDSVYSLAQRTDSLISIEMFNIYQRHHNPQKDIVRAIQLHNPRAGKSYLDKVMKEFNQLKQSA